jgi:hypothetical protein
MKPGGGAHEGNSEWRKNWQFHDITSRQKRFFNKKTKKVLTEFNYEAIILLLGV